MKVTILSTTTQVVADKMTSNNIMNVNGELIKFSTTFKVETKEVFDKLINLKKGRMILFQKEESKVVNNALLKIEREQCHNRLLGYSFLVYENAFEDKVLVIRERD